ncbi:LysR family transcriptional regulator [uncultured Lentibacter sp.]|jgi:DNA-binding transcriptional LysR family regulator|uniref:LysR family transcriptional regulator n=1 Tax=uncultured Lentibacter sp. TaxID=1659309 RepID=UPI0026263942|nr:LysR family transcriptional regulator [uncultured Lentibacter sp.]
MNIDAINTFLLLSETGNFSRVAEKSNLTQSTVSARIRVLEETLNVKLFDRSSSGVVLTEAGQKFYKYAAAMRQNWQQGRQEMARSASPKQTIGLGLHMTMWRRFMPAWLLWMESNHPRFGLHVEADYSERLVDYISQGVLDLAITHMPTGLPGLVVEPFMEDGLVMVSRRAIDFAACNPKNYIFIDWSYGYREEHQEKLPEFASATINIGYGAMALDYLRASDCYAYMPQAYVAEDLAVGRLHVVQDAPVLNRPSYLVHSKHPNHPEALAAAIAGLRASQASVTSHKPRDTAM